MSPLVKLGKKKIKGIQIVEEDVKLYLQITCVENLTESTRVTRTK